MFCSVFQILIREKRELGSALTSPPHKMIIDFDDHVCAKHEEGGFLQTKESRNDLKAVT